MSKVGDGEESACATCDRPDSVEDMVACDTCSSWFHFTCANVNEDVSNQPWKCMSCGTPNRNQSVPILLLLPTSGGESSKECKTGGSKKSANKGSVSVASSVKNRAIEIEIRMIEEQERIKEQELKEKKEMMQKKLNLEKQMRDRELALEAKKLADEKAYQEKQLADEEKFRKAQSEMRQQSHEKIKSLVRQLSQCGSDVSSVCQSETEESVQKVES